MPKADVQRDPCTSITATFIVQRALCTPREKGRRTVQKGRPRPKLGTKSLKFKNSENVTQSGPIPPAAGLGPCAPNFGPNIRIECE